MAASCSAEAWSDAIKFVAGMSALIIILAGWPSRRRRSDRAS